MKPNQIKPPPTRPPNISLVHKFWSFLLTLWHKSQVLVTTVFRYTPTCSGQELALLPPLCSSPDHLEESFPSTFPCAGSSKKLERHFFFPHWTSSSWTLINSVLLWCLVGTCLRGKQAMVLTEAILPSYQSLSEDTNKASSYPIRRQHVAHEAQTKSLFPNPTAQ